MEQTPRKKPNRVHPWRDEYVHDLGVRVVDRDANTGDVLAVECRFCAAFGREERVLIEGAKTETNDGSSNDDRASSGQGPHAATTASADDKSANGSSNSEESRHKRKSRARTRSIAQWKTSFRSDNMRSHHVEQHPLKWGAYQQLLALAKKEQAVLSGVLDQQVASDVLDQQPQAVHHGEAGVYAQQLVAFFGDLSASDGTLGAQLSSAAASSVEVALPLSTLTHKARKVSLNKPSSTSRQQVQIQDKSVLLPVDSSTPAEVLVLTEISSLAIVDEIVSTLIDTEREGERLASKDSEGGTSGPLTSSRSPLTPSSPLAMLRPIYSTKDIDIHVLNVSADSAEPPRRIQASAYRIAITNTSEYTYVRQLLAMEDRVKFAQIANIVAISRVQFNLEATLSSVSQDTVCEYAKLVVATDLQMISDMLRGSWAYSLAFQSSEISGFAIDVRVRIPSTRVSGVEDFHVVTVRIPVSKSSAAERSSSSASAMTELITKTLAALDPLWQKKLIGVCDESSLCSMDIVASVLDRIQEAVAAGQPFYRIYRGTQIVEASLIKALDGSLPSTEQQGPSNKFLDQLSAASQYLLSQSQWSKAHGLCPTLPIKMSPWPLLQTLQWFIARREQIGQLQAENEASLSPSKAASLSPEWWVVCLGLTEVLCDYESISQALANMTQSQQRSSAARDALSKFIKDQILKLGVSQVGTDAQTTTTDNADDDDTSLRLNQFLWSKDKVVAFFRSLNLSTRRLYSQLSLPEQANAVHYVGAFVLQALDAMSNMISEGATKNTSSSHSESAAELDADILRLLPTRPLDFAVIERGAVVDFIELHSARLELSFDLAFIDGVSKQIKDLKSLLAAGDPVTTNAKLAAVHSKSFREAWEPVQSLSFVQSLAAGFATAMPHTVSVEARSVRSRACVVSAETSLASLQAEAQVHAIQTETVESAYKSFKLV